MARPTESVTASDEGIGLLGNELRITSLAEKDLRKIRRQVRDRVIEKLCGDQLDLCKIKEVASGELWRVTVAREFRAILRRAPDSLILIRVLHRRETDRFYESWKSGAALPESIPLMDSPVVIEAAKSPEGKIDSTPDRSEVSEQETEGSTFVQLDLGPVLDRVQVDTSKQLDTVVDWLDALEESGELTRSAIDSLEDELKSLRERVASVRHSVDSTRQDVDLTRRDVDSTRQDVDAIRSDVSSQGASLSAHSERLSANEERLSSIDRETASMSQQLGSQQEQQRGAVESIGELRRAQDELSERVDAEAEMATSGLQKVEARLASRSESMVEEVELIRCALRAEIDKGDTFRRGFQRRLEQATSRLSDQLRQLEEGERRLGRAETRTMKLAEAVKTLRGQLEDVDARLEAGDPRVPALEDALSQWASRQTRFEDRLALLEDRTLPARWSRGKTRARSAWSWVREKLRRREA